MTLEERLQGEWLVCVDDQRLEEARSVSVRGQECDFEGEIGGLLLEGNGDTFKLGNGDRLVINRQWDMFPNESDGSIQIVIEGSLGIRHCGWMFRPGLA